MGFNFFDKKTGSGASVNKHLAEELHKPVIKKFKGSKVYARFIDDIWAADLAEMGSLSSWDKNGLTVMMFYCTRHIMKVSQW